MPDSKIAGTFREKPYDNTQILQWHVLLRIVVSFFILFSTIAFHFSENLAVFYALIGANVLVTLLSAFFISTFHDRHFFILSQVLWDIIFVTALIYVSGGISSLFTFMYILSVINTSILLGFRGTLICAGIYYFGYIVILIGQRFDLLQPLFLEANASPKEMSLQNFVFRILLNGLAIMIAAWLSTKVTVQAKVFNRRLLQKQMDIEELKALNEHIVSSMDIGVFSLDTDGKITFVNKSARRMLKLRDREPIGQTLDTVFPEYELQSESSQPLQTAPYEVDGDPRLFNISSSVLADDQGEDIGWIVSFRDVTEVGRMEEEIKRADRLAAVGKLAAGIAHEIRNPLASMSGSIQVLQNELDLDPLNKRLMDIVLREVDRLNKLVTDFLIFARPSKFDTQKVDISALLNETLGILRNDPICRSGVGIEKVIKKFLFVEADSDQLRQLFWNLLTNALQAMPGGGRLTVTAKESTFGIHNRQGVLVAISDTGTGIDEQTLKNMFDPFFTTKEGGSGLGLTMAYKIVENHKGQIWCESEKGKWTTFFLLLPTEKPE